MEEERIAGIPRTQVMNESKEKLLIDIHELSALTGIAVGSLYHWASPSQKRIPCVRLSARCLRFSLPAIREWLADLNEPALNETRHKGRKA
jgi:predicted DNA-binding transcriptional regulator AlpA